MKNSITLLMLAGLGALALWSGGCPLPEEAAVPKAWGTPVLLETDNAGYAYSPYVAGDDLGNAVAVWYQNDGTRDNICYNTYTPGTGWGTAALLETNNAGPASSPQVAMNGSGDAFVVWEQSDGTRYNVWARRRTTAGGWSAPALIETDNAGSAFYPQIAVDGSGNAIAVWNQDDGTRYNIWANRYVPGGGWGTAEIIDGASGNAQNPRIAIDGSGNAIVVWQQTDGVRFNIWTIRYFSGSGWGAESLLETDNAGAAENPQIAFDLSCNAIAVWQHNDVTRYNIWARRYVSGSGWQTAGLLETDNAGSAASPQIAFDGSGNAIAVWYQSDGTRYNTCANRYVAGVGWGAPVLIETDNAGNAGGSRLAFDDAGNAIVVWQQTDGTDYHVWTNRYVSGAGWGAAVLLTTDTAEASSGPRLTVFGSGNAIAVWNQSDGARDNIWARRYQ